MNFVSIWRSCTVALISIVLLSSCSAESPTAMAAEVAAKNNIDQLIVRFELGAPPATGSGKPWGSQCVSDAYADRLKQGRWIGAGMRVIRIDPPVSLRVGRNVASQVAQCPYIEWAEADEVRFVVPGTEQISG